MRDKIIEIARYLGDEDVPCQSCGAVNTFEEVIIDETLTKKNKVRFKAICAHCGGFIKWMTDRKIERLWYGGEMVEIAKLETGLLIWMINKGLHSVTVRKFIRIALLARVDASEVPDIVTTKAEHDANKSRINLRKELESKILLIGQNQEAVLANFAVWDSIKMGHVEANIKTWKRRVETLKKKLA